MTDEYRENLIEARLNSGLLDYWHPVLPSWALQDSPVGITRLSQNIVLWRDKDGRAYALEDRCPHRGARLSLGWNLGDRITCWYHGVEVAGDGLVVDVPATDHCAIKGKHCVRSYPVEEKADAIFVYFGSSETAKPSPPELPEELWSAEFSHRLCVAHWKCNYRYAIDNVMDPMHGAYLHAASHSMACGDRSAEMKVRKTDKGLFFEKTTQQGVNFDWVEFGESGCLWLRLAIPYQERFGPGGPFGIVGFATPVDENNTMVFFWRNRKVSGWQRSVWRFLYRNRLEGLHWAVLEQDRVILEDMAPHARDRESLYQHDVGLARVRQFLRKRAAAQVDGAEAAAE
ncbi:MAG: aromatic ring-hydroxylating dioxygenase subunit alpha [Alphaproteobacteria bacterium]|nr:aromatic ring-hydroxylating dioxygenase subunit alpha [Alphaproteobacteria bacterium]